MADRFEDERGLIEDILPGPIDAVTRIFTRKGAVRGNHVHEKTVQWTYVISGSLYVVHVRDDWAKPATRTYGPGEMMMDDRGEAHAWRAEEDTVVLVFTRGPRSGEEYESDTTRLETPLIVAAPDDRACKDCAPGYGHNNPTYNGPPDLHDSPEVQW